MAFDSNVFMVGAHNSIDIIQLRQQLFRTIEIKTEILYLLSNKKI
jgi:hypothetical protein